MPTLTEEEKKNLATPGFNYSMQNKPEFGVNISGGSGTQRVNDINAGIIQPDINAGSGVFDAAFSNPYGSGIGLAKPSSVSTPTQNIQQQQDQTQNISNIAPNGLNQIANIINKFPDTSKWESSDVAKANEFALYGNPWNSSMNNPTSIPQQNKYSEPNIQQPVSSSLQTTSDKLAVPVQKSEVYKIYDAAGNGISQDKMIAMEQQYADREMARSLVNQLKSIGNSSPQTREVIGYTPDQIVKGKHGSSYTISGEPIYNTETSDKLRLDATAKALSSFSPLVGSVTGNSKDLATSNLYNAQAVAMPEKTAAENTYHQALANAANEKAKGDKLENDYMAANPKVFDQLFTRPYYDNQQSINYQQPGSARSRLNKILGLGR